ncbi:MAG: hypothetical protein RLZZ609_2238 [Cyanobacteriota bacterium]|jgi:hypothetical protein
MLSKFKTLPVLAAMAGGLLAAGALAPSPTRAADCPTVDIAALYIPGSEFLCGDKKYYEFSSADFDVIGSASFSQSPDGTVHTISFSDFTGQGLPLGTYTLNFKVDVTPPQMIINELSSVTSSGGSGYVDSLTLTSSPNPYEYTGVLEINDPNTFVTNWRLEVVQTPGPLPVLGAGAAFGFSRKLRRRIKTVA